MDEKRTVLVEEAQKTRAIDFEAWKERELARAGQFVALHLREPIEQAIATFLKPEAMFVADVLQDLSDLSGYVSPKTREAAFAVVAVCDWTPHLIVPEEVASGLSDEERRNDASAALSKVVTDAMGRVRIATKPCHTASHALAYTKLRALDLVQMRKDAGTYLAAAEKASESLRATQTMVEKAAADVSRLTIDAGLVNEAKSFSAASQAFRYSAYWWTGATITSAALSCGALVYFMWLGEDVPYPTAAWSVAGNLSHFAPRATLVSILLFMLVVCVRNFRAARHNQILNAHRSATVTTVQILAPPTEDRVREAMLLQASQSVFSPASTGYDGKEPMVPSTLPDILRELKGGRGKEET